MSIISLRTYLSSLGVLSLLFMVWADEPQRVDGQVSIPDANLEIAIRQALNKTNSESITVADMESLTILDGSEETLSAFLCCVPLPGPGSIWTGFDSLDGLQFARNLVSLNLAADMWSHDGGPDPQLSRDLDFSPLAALTKLEILNLAYNWVANTNLPATLASLTNLQSLDLGWNSLPDLSFLDNLTQLRSLNLSANPVTNWSSLAKMKNLENLVLRGSSLVEAPFLAALTHLQSLDLSYNRITNWSFLPALTDLETLVLQSLDTRELILPGKMSNLRSLDLSANARLTLPPGLTNLQELWLDWAGMTSLTLPADMTRLQSLYLRQTQVRTLSIPESLQSTLQKLDLSDNPIADFSFLANLHRLESLNLSRFNRAQVGPSRITLPEGLTGLKELILGYGTDPLARPAYLALPASIDLAELRLVDFPKSNVTVLGFYLRPPIFEPGGRISLRVSGATGKNIAVQRSHNLVDWETWKTATLIENRSEFSDSAASLSAAFFRVQSNSPN